MSNSNNDSNTCNEWNRGQNNQCHYEGNARNLVDRKTAAKPDIFNGKDTEFVDWTEKVIRMIGAIIPDARRLMEWAENQKTAIDNTCVKQWGDENAVYDALHLNEQIWHSIMQYTDGRAKTTVKRCELCGAEAWRQLQEHHNPRTISRKMEIIHEIHSPKYRVRDEELIETVEKWETNVMLLHKLFNEDLSEAQKITILASICSVDTAVQVHQRAMYNNYEKVKREVFEIVRMKIDTNRRVKGQYRLNNIENEVQEENEGNGNIDALYKGKGAKGKGKNTGKNQCARCGKSGHWASDCHLPPPPKCETCGRHGHKTAECFYSGEKGKSKSYNSGKKGYGKNYGKGKGKKGINGVEEEEYEGEEYGDHDVECNDEGECNHIGGIGCEDHSHSEWKGDMTDDGDGMSLCYVGDSGFTQVCNNKRIIGRWRPSLKKMTTEVAHGNRYQALVTNDSEEINAVETENECEAIQTTSGNMNDRRKNKLTVTVDSGASTSVMPEFEATTVQIEESDASKRNIRFRAANGNAIYSKGKRKIKGHTENGDKCTASFEVCKVTKTLGAVSDMVDKGNKVVFDAGGSYILNKSTGRKTYMRRRGGVFEFDIWYDMDGNSNRDDGVFNWLQYP